MLYYVIMSTCKKKVTAVLYACIEHVAIFISISEQCLRCRGIVPKDGKMMQMFVWIVADAKNGRSLAIKGSVYTCVHFNLL
jgi:hypothetical protein